MGRKGDFLMSKGGIPIPDPDPTGEYPDGWRGEEQSEPLPKVAMFELRTEDERDALIAWAQEQSGEASPQPDVPVVRVGDIVIYRGGTFEVWGLRKKSHDTATGLPVGYYDPSRAQNRLSVLQIVSSMPRFGRDVSQSVLGLAEEYEKWVNGDSE